MAEACCRSASSQTKQLSAWPSGGPVNISLCVPARKLQRHHSLRAYPSKITKYAFSCAAAVFSILGVSSSIMLRLSQQGLWSCKRRKALMCELCLMWL